MNQYSRAKMWTAKAKNADRNFDSKSEKSADSEFDVACNDVIFPHQKQSFEEHIMNNRKNALQRARRKKRW